MSIRAGLISFRVLTVLAPMVFACKSRIVTSLEQTLTFGRLRSSWWYCSVSNMKNFD